ATPTLFCPHGWAHRREDLLSFAVLPVLDAWASKRASAVHCISLHEYVAASRLGLKPSALHYIPNRIPDEAPKSGIKPMQVLWPKGRLRVAFAGRFDRQKGFDLLLATAELTRNTAHYVCAGDFIVDARRTQRDLPDNVQLIGWRSSAEVHQLFSSAD